MTTRRSWFLEPGIDLWVGFVNTVVISDGEPADRLDYRSATGRWAAANGLGPPAEFEQRWDRTPEADYRTLKRHRDRLRQVLDGSRSSDLRPDLEVSANGLLDTQPTWRRYRDGQLEVGISDQSLLVLLPLAGLSAIEFLRHGDAHRVKQCRSEECILFFVDETRPGNRRWCDGTQCGNRERVRRHAERAAAGV